MRETMRHLKKWLRVSLLPALLLLLPALASVASVASAQETLDLKKAVKIGSGKIMVIEFTDPDCPYCRRAEAYFQGKGDRVTRYVFFIPLKQHPDAKAKVQYVLSAKDKARAFQEVSSDSFDKRKLKQITPAGKRLQKEHEAIARANKMTSTPTFIIYGRIIEGFDVKQLESVLKP